MWRRSIAAARSAAAYGDDFTVDGRPSHLNFSSPFAPFSLLIEDPEGNKVRSVQWHPCPSVPHALITVHQPPSKTRRGRNITHTSSDPPVAAPSDEREELLPRDHLADRRQRPVGIRRRRNDLELALAADLGLEDRCAPGSFLRGVGYSLASDDVGVGAWRSREKPRVSACAHVSSAWPRRWSGGTWQNKVARTLIQRCRRAWGV